MTAAEVNTKKKLKVFFPSDHTIKDLDLAEEIKQTETLKAAVPSLVGYKSNTGMGSKHPFVLVLGDQTYQQYCMGQVFGVSFYDKCSNTIIQTTYTLCFLSKFPFFPYLSYLVTQVEDDLKYMHFDSPLPRFDSNFPLNTQLRLLNDLFIRLNKIMIPLYPSLISSHEIETGENIAKRLESASPTAILPNEEQNYIAVVPDVMTKLLLRNSDQKLIDFKRSLYQVFYSRHSRNLEELSDSMLAHIRFHEKFKKDFVPTMTHKLEKEREDTFLILQWALPTLLKYLPLDQVILCLGCAVTEMKIIVKHKDTHVISSVILALIHLLKPLKWCSPVIVTLPDELKDLVGRSI
jgi:hypothetical protein